jgi:hypothetical protein
LIMGLAAEYPRATDVWRRFQELAADNGWTDIPGERTVKRRVEEFQRLAPKKRSEYGRFQWPQTMLDNVLPWEASRTGLDLLRYYTEQDRAIDAWAATQGLGPRLEGEGWGRPSVREVRWLWRVQLAAPWLEFEAALRLSGWLQHVEWAKEIGADQEFWTYDQVELALAYKFDRGALAARVPLDWLDRIEHGVNALGPQTDPKQHGKPGRGTRRG